MEELKDLENMVRKGLIEAYRKMVIFKQQRNSPLVVSEDGKVKLIPSTEIQPDTCSKN